MASASTRPAARPAMSAAAGPLAKSVSKAAVAEAEEAALLTVTATPGSPAAARLPAAAAAKKGCMAALATAAAAEEEAVRTVAEVAMVREPCSALWMLLYRLAPEAALVMEVTVTLQSLQAALARMTALIEAVMLCTAVGDSLPFTTALAGTPAKLKDTVMLMVRLVAAVAPAPLQSWQGKLLQK